MKLYRLAFFAVSITACPYLLNAVDLRTVCSGQPKFHVENIIGGSHTYTIRMEGRIDGEMTRDPVGYWAYDQYWEPNLYVRLENVGQTPLVNPWLRRADRPDTRTLKSIVDYVVKPGMSDAEKARALWEFEIKHRFHATTDDDEVNDVVKVYNCYGYTLCYNESLIMSDLWRTAGLKVRKGFPNGHSTAEVFYDSAWHLLDSDESIICLLRDNETIASEAQIVADHDLMKRTHTYGPLHDDSRMRDEGSTPLHYYEGERKGEHPSLTSHSMDFTLRPGEAITWAWNPGGRFHGKAYQGSETESYFWNKRWRLIAHVMDGELSYAPDLSDPATQKYIEKSGVVLRESGPFGAGLYLQGDSGSVVLPVASAYPVVGGRLEVDFARREMDKESLRVSVSYDDGENWKEIWTSAGSEYARMYIDLNEFFPMHEPARYSYRLRFDLLSQTPEPQVCLKGLYLRSTLQMALLAMPGVSLGSSRFIYTDQSPVPGKVKITHAWRECSAADVPGKPEGALYPPDGGTAEGTLFTFRWQAPRKDLTPADYEFQLSEFPDMRRVFSPNFHKLVSRTADRNTASFSIPYLGLLNPDETYYWQVRARSSEGVWGPWSKTFSFTVKAPAVPLDPAASFDKNTRTVTLSWKPGKGGTKAVSYRVYGSAERGFTASDTAYFYYAGLEGTKHSLPNLLFQTEGPETSWNIPPQAWRPYYRVSAVDSTARESGPSDMAELTHPLIVTDKIPEGSAGNYYGAEIKISASIGHLVSADENGKAYQMRFRTQDEMVFKLDGAPAGLSIDPKSGLIAGFLPKDAAGEYELSVTVNEQSKGLSDKRKLVLKVVER
ncbi:MAG TPA: Ig domain-containing protein [archaeon]|nr:Ig domain-containing protein [archaeon]